MITKDWFRTKVVEAAVGMKPSDEIHVKTTEAAPAEDPAVYERPPGRVEAGNMLCVLTRFDEHGSRGWAVATYVVCELT